MESSTRNCSGIFFWHLSNTASWKTLRALQRVGHGHKCSQPAPPDGFIFMLEILLAGGRNPLEQPRWLTEPPWTLETQGQPFRNSNPGKVAMKLVSWPTCYGIHWWNVWLFLCMCNEFLCPGDIPTMRKFAKRREPRCQLISGQAPASVFDKRRWHACRRIGASTMYWSHINQRKHHGFRQGHRLEEHLVAANLFLFVLGQRSECKNSSLVSFVFFLDCGIGSG